MSCAGHVVANAMSCAGRVHASECHVQVVCMLVNVMCWSSVCNVTAAAVLMASAETKTYTFDAESERELVE